MFTPESETRYPSITGEVHSIRPVLAAEDVKIGEFFFEKNIAVFTS